MMLCGNWFVVLLWAACSNFSFLINTDISHEQYLFATNIRLAIVILTVRGDNIYNTFRASIGAKFWKIE